VRPNTAHLRVGSRLTSARHRLPPFPGARRVPASVRHPVSVGAGGSLAHALGCAGLDIPAHSSPCLLGRARLEGRLAKTAARRATHRRPQARRRGNQKRHAPVLSAGVRSSPLTHAHTYNRNVRHDGRLAETQGAASTPRIVTRRRRATSRTGSGVE
jgi:hypothetical protein